MSDDTQVVHVARNIRNPRSSGSLHWSATVEATRELLPGDLLELETLAGRKAAVVIGTSNALRETRVYTKLVNADAARRALAECDPTDALSRLRLRTQLCALPAASPAMASLGNARLVPQSPAAALPDGSKPCMQRAEAPRDAGTWIPIRCEADVEPLFGKLVRLRSDKRNPHVNKQGTRVFRLVDWDTVHLGWVRFADESVGVTYDSFNADGHWDVQIVDASAVDRTEPAPGYTVRVSSLGWVYEGRRNGQSNSGVRLVDAIAETWEWHDFDHQVRGEAQQLCADLQALDARPCSTCMGAKVLRHADPARVEEPCPDCPPAPMQGPSEWTLTKREVRHEPLMVDGSYSAEHVTVQRHQQVATFRVIAHHDGGDQETDVLRREIKYAGSEWGDTALCIRGEACIDMAIARLLCGLRDGSVQP